MPLVVYLVRHGDTEWSQMRRLAGRIDLPLTAIGEFVHVKITNAFDYDLEGEAIHEPVFATA